jgi:outer membrane protein assembly factor BamB
VAEDLPRRTITSSPLVVEGLVFIGSNDFTLHAIDLATGIERWNAVVGFQTVSSPSYKDGTVFFGTEGGVYAVDAASGHILWAGVTGLKKPDEEEDEEEENADEDGDGTSNGQEDDDGDGTPNTEDDDDDGDGTADSEEGEDVSLAADLENGALTVSELMDTEAGKFTWNVIAAPVVVDNLVYAVGFQESEAKIQGTDRAALAIGTMLQLDIATGVVTGIWYFKTWDDVMTTPAIVDSTIYLGSDRGMVYAVEAQIVSETLIDFGTDNDETGEISFAANQQRWGHQTEKYVLSSPAVVGESVYLGNAAGTFYAFDVNTGRDRWTFQTGGPIWSSPAISNGMVYFGSDDGFLYALGGAD